MLKANNQFQHKCLQLLGELLLDRSSVKIMVRFVSEVQHLMQMMMLLKDPSKSIQFEAFHVFKVRSNKIILLCLYGALPKTAASNRYL